MSPTLSNQKLVNAEYSTQIQNNLMNIKPVPVL